MKEKHFREWIGLKEKLHFGAKVPRISEGEVWWCSFGENVGVEINGKSERFTRPVVIMRKLSKFGFMGIPLTSQEKTGSWYAKFIFLGKKCAPLARGVAGIPEYTFIVSNIERFVNRATKKEGCF